MSPILLIVVNDPAFFISHRLPIAEAARKEGYWVHVATMPGDAVSSIVEKGFEHHTLPLTRSGRNPLSELKALIAVYCLLKRLKPNLVHLVTIKPVLYGGIAARLAKVPGVLAAISGLGFSFVSKGLLNSILRPFLFFLYRIALGHSNIKVVFQNPSDQDILVSKKIVKQERTKLIRGSGVDLDLYGIVPEYDGVPVVCLAARLLKDKGVYEFVNAARILRERGVNARFQLIGDVDPGNPATVSDADVQAWRKEGVIELLGYRTDIPELFARAHVVVLPSYREGLPKVLMEAAACGRAVVTTDVPGCRDAIVPDVTGLLVPVCDAEGLADAMEALIRNPELRKRMGEAGRKLAEREFSVDKIVEQHLVLYQDLQTARNPLCSGLESSGTERQV